jgi:hypothetical protein
MKWQEMMKLPVETLLQRIGSGRLAKLVNKNEPIRLITVQYLDTGKVEERANPNDYTLPRPPAVKM